ncbi:MAG: hypothetical protein GF364_13670 [Candidatus Lokiarchaeota archaeon]|nr:hypothetical protein [Candidatus Lokiarchaeota archaeon]
MQIERILKGETVICEMCGYEYSASIQDYRDMIPNQGMEPQNLYEPDDFLNKRTNVYKKQTFPRMRPPHPLQHPRRLNMAKAPQKITVDDNHPQINEKNIIQNLSHSWKTLKQLAEDIGIHDRREFYILRMKLNEMNRNKQIKMDFQLHRVLIRKIH